jgi:hypothetical protein
MKNASRTKEESTNNTFDMDLFSITVSYLLILGSCIYVTEICLVYPPSRG